MSRPVSTLRLIWRFITSDLRAGLVLVLVTVLAAGLLTAWPRALDRISGTVLETGIRDTNASTRDLTATTTAISYGGAAGGTTQLEGEAAEVLGAIDVELHRIRAALPQPLTSFVAAGHFEKVSVEVPIAGAADSDIRFSRVQLVTDPYLQEQVELSRGRWPDPFVGPELTEPDAQNEYFGWVDPEEPIEVTLEESSAARLDWNIGETRSADAFQLPALHLVGTYSVLNPDDGYWVHSTLGAGPRIIDDPDLGITVTAAAHMTPVRYASLETFPLGTRTNFWFPLEPADIAFEDVTDLTSQLRGFTAARHEIQGPITFSSELLATLDAVVREVGALRSAVAFLASGALAAIATVLIAAVQSMQDRRRRELALLRARGGSGRQLRALMAGLGLILGLPAAAVGWSAASLLVPTQVPTAGLGLAVLAGLAPAVVLAWAVPSAGLRSTQRSDAPRSSKLRWLVELLVVAVAAIAVILVLSRPIDRTTIDVDPLLAAVPALLAIVVAILALRVTPVLLRSVLSLAKAGRGPAAFLGLARATRAASGRLIPLLALVIAVSVTVLSGALLTSVRAGLESQSWNISGGDVRVSGPIIAQETVAGVEQLPPVRAATTIADFGSASVRTGTDKSQIHLLVADSGRLSSVQHQIPNWELPQDFAQTADGSVPVVMSEVLAERIGTQAQLILDSEVLDLDVRATRSSVPGARDTASWLLADAGVVEALTGKTFAPRILLIDLDDAWLETASQQERNDLAEQIETLVGPALFEFRAADAASQTDAPGVAGLYGTLQIVMIVAGVMGALTLLVTEVNAARAREQTAAVLKVLGMRSKRLAIMTAWEIGSWAMVGLISGFGLGLGAAELATRVVDLGAFLGTDAIHTVYDAGWLTLTVVGFVMIVAATSFVAATVGRRADAAAMLRQVEERAR